MSMSEEEMAARFRRALVPSVRLPLPCVTVEVVVGGHASFSDRTPSEARAFA
jgi:hypothetical protein